MPLEVQEWAKLIERLGVGLGLAVIFVMGLLRRWWIIGSYHEETVAGLKAQLAEVKDDRDEWKRAALAGTTLAESAVRYLGEPRRR